jgi:hypothetical protein
MTQKTGAGEGISKKVKVKRKKSGFLTSRETGDYYIRGQAGSVFGGIERS